MSIPGKRKGEIAPARHGKNKSDAQGSASSDNNPFPICHIWADLSSERQDKMSYLKNQSGALINSHVC